MAELDSGEPQGDVKQGFLQSLEENALLRKQAPGFGVGLLQFVTLGGQDFGLRMELFLASGQLFVLPLQPRIGDSE
jgi:hypothetical protein